MPPSRLTMTPTSRHAHQPLSEAEWVNFAPFLYHDGRLSVNFKEGSYYYRYKFPESPRFTPLEEEALR